MQGLGRFDPQTRTVFDLESFVADDHLLRRVDRELDLAFIRDLRKESGGPGMPFVIANSGFAGWEQKVDRLLVIMRAQAAVA